MLHYTRSLLACAHSLLLLTGKANIVGIHLERLVSMEIREAERATSG